MSIEWRGRVVLAVSDEAFGLAAVLSLVVVCFLLGRMTA